MELIMFTPRAIVSRPLKHLIFLLFSIKCQHVSEFISPLHFDVCLDVKPILGMSWWHPNRSLLTHLPLRSFCYFAKCLWVLCRENACDNGIRALIRVVFLCTFFRHCRKFILTTDWHSYQWFLQKSGWNIASVVPAFLVQNTVLKAGKPHKRSCPGLCAVQLWSHCIWGFDSFIRTGLLTGPSIPLICETRATSPLSAGPALPRPLRLILSPSRGSTSSLI